MVSGTFGYLSYLSLTIQNNIICFVGEKYINFLVQHVEMRYFSVIFGATPTQHIYITNTNSWHIYLCRTNVSDHNTYILIQQTSRNLHRLIPLDVKTVERDTEIITNKIKKIYWTLMVLEVNLWQSRINGWYLTPIHKQ